MTRPARRLGIAYFPARPEKNPYIRLWYRHLQELGFETIHDGRLELDWLCDVRGHVGFLHFHWNTHRHYEYRDGSPKVPKTRPWLGVASFAGRLVAARAMGYRIVWTIHEVYPHESPSRSRDRVAARILAGLSNVLLAHDRPTAERAVAEFGLVAKRVHVLPHGSYIGFYPRGRPRLEVRERLGLDPDAFVFLALGRIRHYKKTQLLLEAFRLLERDDVALVIAGYPEAKDVAEAARKAAEDDPRIRFLAELVPEEEIAELYGASDAAVLPRGDGWTSGSLILALSEGVPAVAARTPAYEELLGGEEAGWLFEPGSVASLRDAMDAAASDPEAARAKGEAARRRAERLSWAEAAEQAARLMIGERR